MLKVTLNTITLTLYIVRRVVIIFIYRLWSWPHVQHFAISPRIFKQYQHNHISVVTPSSQVFVSHIFLLNTSSRVGSVMVSELASSAIDCGFETRSSQTKEYKIGMCCVSAKHASLRSKSKDWMTRNQNNVSEWSDISTRGLLFQWASTMKFQLSLLV